ncbi:hypothetical protein REPUB_Repub18cG0040400 [Reevesia pubescens]
MFGRPEEWEVERIMSEADLDEQRVISEESDKQLESMFGREEWEFQRIISEADLEQKRDIIVLVAEVNKYIVPGLKRKEVEDLADGKAINILLFDEDSKDYYNLKLHFSRP